jgi:uncharacterized protein YegL
MGNPLDTGIQIRRPGGVMAKRPLHFIWLLDCSGSMSLNGKIDALNTAIRELIPHMQRAAAQNSGAEVLIRAIRFSTAAQWHIAQPTLLSEFRWTDLTADPEARTNLGAALRLVAEEMKMPPLSPRSLPPALVLISDGRPTDDFEGGMQYLLSQPWGKASTRLSIGIGTDAHQKTLKRFIDNPEIHVLQADNPEALVEYMRFVSTSVLSGRKVSSVVPQPAQTAPSSVIW